MPNDATKRKQKNKPAASSSLKREKRKLPTRASKRQSQRREPNLQVVERSENEVVYEFIASDDVGDERGAMTSPLCREKTIELPEHLSFSSFPSLLPTQSEVASVLDGLKADHSPRPANAQRKGKAAKSAAAIRQKTSLKSTRKSSSRGSLTSQPTLDATQLEGVSHLRKIAPRQPGPITQLGSNALLDLSELNLNLNSSQTQSLITSVSAIEKMELTDSGKMAQKNIEAHLKRILQSIIDKQATAAAVGPSPSQQTISVHVPQQNPVTGNSAPANNAITIEIRPNQQQTPVKAQQPSLKTINTEMVIQEILANEQPLGEPSQNAPVHNIQTLQVTEPNVAPNPTFGL